MAVFQTSLEFQTPGRGLHRIDAEVADAVREIKATGTVNLFIQHTSASLVIQENADPTARRDLEEFLDRLVPEGESWYRHLDEGPDDTVSHMRAAITATSLVVPIRDGRLLLGTWQGIYLWEHRRRLHTRKIVVTVLS